MIQFKQKEFWGAALTVGTSALGLMQGASANAANEEAQRKQLLEQKKHNRAMEAAAKNNPILANAVEEQKSFAVNPSAIMSGVKGAWTGLAGRDDVLGKAAGLATDFAKTQKGNIKTAGKTALGFGATAYLGNRLATSIKDHNEGNDSKNKSFLKKAALTGAAVGTGILAAKKGYLGTPIKNFMRKDGIGGKSLNIVKESINPIARNENGKISVGGTLKKTAMTGFLIGMPTMGYLSSKKKKDDLIENQNQYSDSIMSKFFSDKKTDRWKNTKRALLGAGAVAATAGTLWAGKKYGGSVMNSIKSVAPGLYDKGRAAKTYFKDKTKTIKQIANDAALKTSSGINNAASFIGMYGVGGTDAVQNTATSLAKASENGINHEWSNKVGSFFNDHKILANVAATGATAAAGSKIPGLANKAVEAPTRILDKDAYKMNDQENQKV